MNDYKINMILRKKKQKTVIFSIMVVTVVILLAARAMYTSIHRAVEEKYRLEIDNLLEELTEAGNTIIRLEQISAKVNISVIDTQIKSIDKFTAVEYLYTDVEKFSDEIDTKSLETLDESSGLFNPISTTDAWELNAASKQAMEERAIANGLLEKAAENARTIITGLIEADTAVQECGYTIVFETIQ